MKRINFEKYCPVSKKTKNHSEKLIEVGLLFFMNGMVSYCYELPDYFYPRFSLLPQRRGAF
jgi:hypothetical protein